MAKKNSTRAAAGAGTIRKKTVTRNGKPYTYWEARITTGRDPGTGKQIQRSFSGKTQKEVREKLQAAAVEVNTGTYTAPQRMTVGQWLDIWLRDYLAGRRPTTVRIYANNVKNHIKPALGAIRLSDLRPHHVQTFINGLTSLSAGTVRLVYRILHQALEKAVRLDYLPRNPAADCELPKQDRKEILPLDDEQARAVLEASKNGIAEHLLPVALFTGLRLSELLGLTWNAVDFEKGSVTVDKQLAYSEDRHKGIFGPTKSGKSRTLTPAPSVMGILKARQRRQLEHRLAAGSAWHNPHDLVFTDALGSLLDQGRAEDLFRALQKAAGISGFRFHDLRHTYAVNAIRAGDDIKTIQGNLGHASAAFTLAFHRAHEGGQRRPDGTVHENLWNAVKGKHKGKQASKTTKKPPDRCIFNGLAAFFKTTM